MFCTACNIEIDKSHYSSNLHEINSKRKLVGFTHFGLEEFDSTSLTDDLSLDLFSESSVSTVTFLKAPTKNISNKSTCMYCNEIGTLTHYTEHGHGIREATYIKNLTCYTCEECFSTKESLKRHLNSGEHRNVVTDGTHLYLENGRILSPDRRNLPGLGAGTPAIPKTVFGFQKRSIQSEDPNSQNLFQICKVKNKVYKVKPN